jgi:bacterioferritin-associated ferredoxin
MRSADMACICRSITPEEQITISVMKVVDVAKECGNPVPSGNKCGSEYLTLIFS